MNKEEILKILGFDIQPGICPVCGLKVDTSAFRDVLSVREYNISGLCQNCQDDIFGTGE